MEVGVLQGSSDRRIKPVRSARAGTAGSEIQSSGKTVNSELIWRLAIAKGFAAIDDRVHICDVDEQKLMQVTGGNPAITGSLCDVSDRASVESFVKKAVESLGGIDVLVNNAGISGPTDSVEDMDPDQWDRSWRSI
jgi:hypothetical protein